MEEHLCCPARILAAAAFNGLLLFVLAVVGSCELSNWIGGPREGNAWRSGSKVFPLVLRSGRQTAIAENKSAIASQGRAATILNHQLMTCRLMNRHAYDLAFSPPVTALAAAGQAWCPGFAGEGRGARSALSIRPIHSS